MGDEESKLDADSDIYTKMGKMKESFMVGQAIAQLDEEYEERKAKILAHKMEQDEADELSMMRPENAQRKAAFANKMRYIRCNYNNYCSNP